MVLGGLFAGAFPLPKIPKRSKFALYFSVFYFVDIVGDIAAAALLARAVVVGDVVDGGH